MASEAGQPDGPPGSVGVGDGAPAVGRGAVIVLVLTRSWAPAVGWGAAIVGSTAAALAMIGVGWEARAVGIQPGSWLDLAMFAALVIPAGDRGRLRDRRARTPRSVGGRGLGCGRARCRRPRRASWVARSRGERGAIPEWLWLRSSGCSRRSALVRDLRPAVRPDARRVAAGEAAGTRHRPPVRGAARVRGRARAGRDVGRAEAVESERTRIAADLHAEVLPSLRRALVEAEARRDRGAAGG